MLNKFLNKILGKKTKDEQEIADIETFINTRLEIMRSLQIYEDSKKSKDPSDSKRKDPFKPLEDDLENLKNMGGADASLFKTSRTDEKYKNILENLSKKFKEKGDNKRWLLTEKMKLELQIEKEKLKKKLD